MANAVDLYQGYIMAQQTDRSSIIESWQR